MTKKDPGCGGLVTCAQFLFITLEGFVVHCRLGSNLKTKAPLWDYVRLVVLFFIASVAGNVSLRFPISMPLHMIIKSGSLIANMVLGIVILKKRYNVGKYVSVLLITVGIVICTLSSTPQEGHVGGQPDGSWSQMALWLLGIFILLVSLFVSAMMGIVQETMCSNYGKNTQEAMFYMHALALPGFLLLSTDISHHINIFTASESVSLAGLVTLPELWAALLLNILTQFIGVSSVFTLTTIFTSLTVTFITTIRKFASLLLSIYVFRNVFTAQHWLGSGLVFCGTILFMEVLPYQRRKPPTKTD